MKKALLISLVVLLLAAALLQWGVDRTPAGTSGDDNAVFPTTSSLFDLLGGARQYLAFTFFIKTDKLHHAYYGSSTQEAELVPYFKLVALMDPNYVSAYYVAVDILAALGKREEAIAFTLQGIEANPESADLYYSLGDLYLQEKRFDDAKDAFEEAMKYEPELVSRSMMLTALAASCSAVGDEEGRRKALMAKVLYDQTRLYTEEHSYEEMKTIVTSINTTLNNVMDTGEQLPGEGGS
ncbi:MAG: tetratricopeptide repeat protein [Actinomycetota bacterium]